MMTQFGNIRGFDMKKCNSQIIRIIPLLMILFFLLQAYENVKSESAIIIDDEFLYHVTDNEITIDQYLGESNTVEIPSFINEIPVVSIGEGAFYGAQVVRVTLPEYLQRIENAAFGESAIQEITFPVSLAKIGDGAFALTRLQHVVIPDSVESIGVAAFSSCFDLSSIKLSNSLKALSEYCFFENTHLTQIDLPEGIEVIGDECFYFCTELQSVSLPTSLRNIGEMSFANCSLLTDIKLPEGIKAVGDSCFLDCTSLMSMFIPSTLNTTGFLEDLANPENNDIILRIRENPEFVDYAIQHNIPYLIVP